MDLTHKEKQKFVKAGVHNVAKMCAILFPIVYYFQPAIFLPNPVRGRQDQLKWFIPVLGNLLWRIFVITRIRSGNPKCIDGSAFTKEEPQELTVLRALLQNTVEQTVALVLTHLIWIFCMPEKFLVIQPVSVIIFLVGRISYAKGYTQSTQGRAMGFALGFISTAILLLIEMVWFVGAVLMIW
jgi:uncharacterized membrane protein YecN with MAPEG domain